MNTPGSTLPTDLAPRVRVGAVNYLNTRPLVFGLAERARYAGLSYDLPSRLADQLAGGQLDVALIPSIEFFHSPGYRIVSDACIACRGPVLSVKLFSRTPIESIRTLALDEGSRTSIALVRILLAQRYGVEPDLLPLAIGASVDDARADAVLVIGDRAIQSPGGRFAEVWDLGEEWVAWTGKPFVFAMWVARPDVPLEELEEDLSLARDEGVSHLSEIAAREAAALGLTRPQCLSYLRDNLHFYFGPEERDGLQLFYDKAAELRLVPSGRELIYQR